jgi:hypothetical protein
MKRLPLAPPARLVVALAAICLAAFGARAQAPAASSPLAAAPASGQSAQPAAAKPNPENAWLAKTGKLYYSSARAGLSGFDCAVHPDWHTLFVSASKGEPVAEDDARILLLKTVKITLHARMMGGSTIDWVDTSDSGKPLDQSSTEVLDGMHQSVQQTLEGFVQFWSPFIDGSVVPQSADGLDITHTPTVHTIHAKQGETELTEVFNPDLVLEQFNVVLSGTSIKFSPAYESTGQGLLVNGFRAHIVPAGSGPGQAQDMTVAIEYQKIGDIPIPGHLSMEVMGTGKFDFTMDGCAINPK